MSDECTAAVTVDEIIRQRRAAPRQIMVDQPVAKLEQRRGSPARRLAASVALEQLRVGSSALLGVEHDDGDDAALGIDLDEAEGLDLESRSVIGRRPLVVL